MSAYEWRPYVPVAARKQRARRAMLARRKRGEPVSPVTLTGRKISSTFWGNAWCRHLEGFHDFENRLPRGRTYVRNGSVCHLEIGRGAIEALVMGTELYAVEVTIRTLPKTRFNALRRRCAGSVGSLLDLLAGRLSDGVMAVVTDPENGLFPRPGEIRFACSCPDPAILCKHVSATLYGVGARLDSCPEALFLLRGVRHDALIATPASAIATVIGRQPGGNRRRRIAQADLGAVFDIEMEAATDAADADHVASATGRPRRVKSKRLLSGSGSDSGDGSGTAPTRRVPEHFTGAGVARLRARLGLSRVEFARLLEVSAGTISAWESTRGRLSPRRRGLQALRDAATMSRDSARRRLGRR